MPLDMSFQVYNWVSHIIGLIGVMVLTLPTFWLVKIIRKFDTHIKINADNVNRVIIHSESGEREASAAEIHQIIDGYNDAVFIQKREYENPRNGHSGVSIEMKTGDMIHIVPREKDVDITRLKGRRAVTYWARQPKLRNFLT